MATRTPAPRVGKKPVSHRLLVLMLLLLAGAIPYGWYRFRQATEVRTCYQMLDAAAERLRSTFQDRIDSFHRISAGGKFDSRHFPLGSRERHSFRLARNVIRTATFDPDASVLRFHYFGPSEATGSNAGDPRRLRFWEDFQATYDVKDDIPRAIEFMPLFDHVVVSVPDGSILYETSEDRRSDVELKPRMRLLSDQIDASAEPARRHLRGSEFLIFQRSVSLGEKADLVITGLVRSDVFQRRVYLQSRGMIYVVSALALLVFTVPLISSTTKSSLSRLGVLFGIPWAVLLVSCLTISERRYQQLQTRSDQDLTTLAGEIRKALARDLDKVTESMDRLNYGPPRAGTCIETAPPDPIDAYLPKIEEARCVVQGLPPQLPGIPPSVESIAWIDASRNSNGYQRVKWARRDDLLASRLLVGEREYFTHFTKPFESRDGRYFFGSQASWATSGKEAAISRIWRPEECEDGDREKKNCMVLAASFRPASIFDTLLPFGYRFAITDATGRVLFHSDESRNLHENFLRALSWPRELQDVLAGRVEESDVFPGNYDGRRYRFLAQQFGDDLKGHGEQGEQGIDSRAKSLIVFYDQDILTTAQLEALWFSFLSSAMFLAFIEVLVLAILGLGWLMRIAASQFGWAPTLTSEGSGTAVGLSARVRAAWLISMRGFRHEVAAVGRALARLETWHRRSGRPFPLRELNLLLAVALSLVAFTASAACPWILRVTRAESDRLDTLITNKTEERWKNVSRDVAMEQYPAGQRLSDVSKLCIRRGGMLAASNPCSDTGGELVSYATVARGFHADWLKSESGSPRQEPPAAFLDSPMGWWMQQLRYSLPAFDATVSDELRALNLPFDDGERSVRPTPRPEWALPSDPSTQTSAAGGTGDWAWPLLVVVASLLIVGFFVWRLGIAVAQWGTSVSLTAAILPVVLVVLGSQLVYQGLNSFIASLGITAMAHPALAKLGWDLVRGQQG